MRLDSDVVLIGTGVAPLIAAHEFIQNGKTVLILNPDYDFFAENSELPFDPLWPIAGPNLSFERIKRASLDGVLESVRLGYPGSIEVWPNTKGGFQNELAPFIRTRSRLWMRSLNDEDWAKLEDVSVEAMDAGMKPQFFEGISAFSRFPGASAARATTADRHQALHFPKFGDVDVNRFRIGIREFMRERLGEDRMVVGASPIEISSDGVRYRKSGTACSVRVNDGVLIFWTPALTSWILNLALESGVKPELPHGIRVWEEWSLLSKDPVDPSILGQFEEMIAGFEGEGDPTKQDLRRIGVLRAGPLLGVTDRFESGSTAMLDSFASSESFNRISIFCHEFLKWPTFTVRSVRPRLIFEWEKEPHSFILGRKGFETRVFTGADGALASVASTSRQVVKRFLDESKFPEFEV